MDELVCSHGRDEFSNVIMTGTVRMRIGQRFAVDCEGVAVAAVKAFGCVIVPQTGDMVLVARTGSEAGFILSVLERPGSGIASMEFADGVRISSPAEIFLGAAAVAIDSADRMRLSAPALTIAAQRASCIMDETDFSGNRANVHLRQARMLCGKLETIARTILTKAIRSICTVEELLQEKAGRIRLIAQETAEMRGRRARMDADEDVSVSGKQVKLG